MQENQIPATPITPATPPPKNNNFLVILLSILLFISLTIAGFFAYQTQKLTKELVILNNEQAFIPSPTSDQIFPPELTAEEDATLDSTTNWKTFIDKQYGFELKYPESQYTKDKVPTVTCPQPIDGVDQPVCNFSVIDSCSQFECTDLIAINIYKNPKDPAYERNLNDFSGSMSTDKIIDSNINGTPVKMRIFQDQPIEAQIYYVSTNRYSYIIYGNPGGATFQQVISTFKFIN